MNKAKLMIFANALVLVACLAELQEELAEGFVGMKSHHGLIVYALCDLIMRIKEVLEAREKYKKAKEGK